MDVNAIFEHWDATSGEMQYLKVFPLETFPAYKYVVIFARMNGQWLFSRHRARDTWETQGGHIEKGETPLQAAKRELYEESGAAKFEIMPVCDYWSGMRTGCGVGVVYFAKVQELGEMPQSEMKCVRAFDTLPDNVTYPAITPYLYKMMAQFIEKVEKIENRGENP